MTEWVNKDDALAAVEGFTSSWLARDIDRKAKFLTDDFVLWNNCYNVEVQSDVAISFFRWLTTVMRNNKYYDVRRYHTPFGIVQQHLTSMDTDQGTFTDIPMMLVFHTRGQKIWRCEEYVDSTGLPELVWPEGAKFN